MPMNTTGMSFSSFGISCHRERTPSGTLSEGRMMRS